ncbi:MAG TPA: hypothetical protein VHV08_09890 [Pirellulales bacterium]|jgi:hypothetical protein|nr:hypothetical protein [Pirellulales bacterium]
MARRHVDEQEAGNDSSFLDVITNCVGILIILVIIVGERAKNEPMVMAARASAEKLAAARADAAALERDTFELAGQVRNAQGEVAARSAERTQVNTLVAAIEHELNDRRAQLDDTARRRYDLDRDLALARAELSRLEIEREQTAPTVVKEVLKVESYPTPIGRTVEGKEAHFQLLGGHLAFVPFDAFIEKLQDRMREYARDPEGHAELVDTLGPIGGFRMRYSLERFDTPRGTMVRPAHIEMIPVSSHLGETIDVALSQRSQLRDKLEMMSPRLYTITVWTYADSFAEYRRLKKELYSLGYPVAARPLLDGMPIAASPNGSKSSSE